MKIKLYPLSTSLPYFLLFSSLHSIPLCHSVVVVAANYSHFFNLKLFFEYFIFHMSVITLLFLYVWIN